jgi:hypothetical protein
MRALAVALAVAVAIAAAAPVAHADGSGDLLAATPRDQALKLYAQATQMFGDDDFVAAAVTFGQAEALFARVDRDATGAVVDKEAHSYRNAALSNEATAYSRASLWVEANAAFVALRDQFGGELAATDRQEIDDAIARTNDRIGTLVLRGLPAGDLEVRLDGRLERRDVRAPLRLSEGEHALAIDAPKFRPYAVNVTIVGKQELDHAVALHTLETPARVRVESTVPASRVRVDANELDAPAELVLAPGRHHVVVSSESYATQDTDLDVQPGERTVLTVALARARAPLGLRVEPGYLAMFPLRTDTPFGRYDGTLALALYHDAVRARNLRFGLDFEYTPRRLNAAAVGATGTWCPDGLAWRESWAQLAWCPATATLDYVFGDRDGAFDTGVARARGETSVEVRRTHGFARLSIGLQLEDYAHDITNADGSTSSGFFFLVSSVVQASVGLDL